MQTLLATGEITEQVQVYELKEDGGQQYYQPTEIFPVAPQPPPTEIDDSLLWDGLKRLGLKLEKLNRKLLLKCNHKNLFTYFLKQR